MDPSRPPPPLATLVSFRAAEHSISTLLPSAHLSGEPVRALLLRRRGRDWPLAISAVATDRLLEVSASAVAGPAYVAVFFATHSQSSWAAPWAMGGMLFCVLGLALFYVRARSGAPLLPLLFRGAALASLRDSVETIERNIRSFLRSPSFLPGLALSALAEAIVLAELWTLVQAFALPISLATLVGVMVGMGIAQLVPVPAAIGSLEATEVGVVTLAGGGGPLGLAVGLIVRLRETLWILVGLVALYLEGLSWTGIGASAAGISSSTSAIEPKA